MSFEVQTEFKGLDPEAARTLVAMQHAIRGAFETQEKRNRRPKRPVTELVEEGSVQAKPGQVVRVRPSDENIEVVLPPVDSGNGGEDIIVSFEGDGTAAGKVVVTPASGTCAKPGTTTLNTPGSYRFTSTGAASEGSLGEPSAWSGPAPVSLEDLPPVATDTLVGNISGSTGTPVEVPLASLDSTSIVYDAASHTFQRAAVTGAVSAAQNTNATQFAGIRDNGSLETARGFVNFLSTTSLLADVAQDAGSDELEVSLQRAALTGAIVATQNSNATRFAGILDNGAAENDRTNLNFLNSTSINLAVGDDAGGDELEITAQRAALTGAIAAPLNSNATVFSGVLNNGAATTDQPNMNFVSTTSILADVGNDAVNSEMEVNFQRAALTGEVTAAQNANATTVVRSTDFDTSPWTGNHQFDAQLAVGTATVDASTGSVNVTLGATSTRLQLSGNGTITLGTVSGCADGRLLFVDFSGTGTHTVTHDSATANAFACPENVDLVINGRGGFIAMGRSTNWKILAPLTNLRPQNNTWTGSNTYSSTVSLGQKVLFAGAISPSQITADQDNYSPTGWSTSNVVRLSSDATHTITGAAAGSSGEVKWLVNTNTVASARHIFLSAEDGSSSAANRFITTSTGLLINAGGGVAIVYDGTSSRWRAISPF